MFKSYFRGAERDALNNYFRLPSSAQTAVLFAPISASGGVETTIAVDGRDYRVHTFLSSGTFDVTDVGTVGQGIEYLVVAGGGAGGGRLGAPGGAGGLLTNLGGTKLALTLGSQSITVGTGGTGRSEISGTKGTDSSAFGLTAFGGGAGAGDINRASSPGMDGGSGAGGSATGSSGDTTIVPGGSGVSGQGNDGGSGIRAVDGSPTGNDCQAGGGGGAGGTGLSGPASTGRDGGDGLQVDIDGNNHFWAGGGGGSAFRFVPAGKGGRGGGGGGAHTDDYDEGFTGQPGGGGALNAGGTGGTGTDTSDGGDAGANTGGGGGGGAWQRTRGGNGGSGIVIVRYPLTS